MVTYSKKKAIYTALRKVYSEGLYKPFLSATLSFKVTISFSALPGFIPAVTTSPCFMEKTPEGVPVSKTSPASNFIIEETYSIREGILMIHV